MTFGEAIKVCFNNSGFDGCASSRSLVVGLFHVIAAVVLRSISYGLPRRFPRDVPTEHRGDGEAAPRHGPKRMASAARVNSGHRVDSSHHLVRGAGKPNRYGVHEPQAPNSV